MKTSDDGNTTGVLIECDPSVKAIILKYDEEQHDYIVEDLDDDRHLVIKESQLQNLKDRLGKVRRPESILRWIPSLIQHYRIWMRSSCSRRSRNQNSFVFFLICSSVSADLAASVIRPWSKFGYSIPNVRRD